MATRSATSQGRLAISRTDTSTEHSDGPSAPRRATPALAVVLVADRPDAGSFAVSLDGVSRVVIARGSERRAQKSGSELLLELPDRRISKPHAALERDGDGFSVADLGSSNGTFLGEVRMKKERLPFDAPLRVGHTFLAVLEDGGPVAARAAAPWPFTTLSAAFARELLRLERVAASPLPLLLLGETGTGKEVLARAVHQRSGRPGAFVAVNCGALPANLVEALIFGHQKGAFSGALRDELGFVRSADHGTLFLDEIGDLALTAQASLLRVLQESEVVPVGSFQPVKVDVRILSATHHALADRAAAGLFRADLLARLSGFTFHVPPLRERQLDVGELLASLSREKRGCALSPDAAFALLTHDYPMNVRELRHAIEAAAVLAEDGVARLHDLPTSIGQPSEAAPPSAEAEGLQPGDAAIRDELVARLQASDWNFTQVAREMGKARQQIQRWVKRFGLRRR